MSIILKAENISKQYRLGTVGAGTLGDDLKRIWYKMQGKEDPFLKVGAVNQRNSNADGEDYVWALRNINFEVKQGEVLGIIGKNGAGKSTLLKLLSRVTSPTTGTIKTRGRIASLLEVGTGFHGELTGRENIFMNGAVLGMTKTEIKSKLDEIIAFSGCERYIDTPVKRYSSGMTVRLGFAVAAHLEPDILVVDEVLAVGDAEFQKKAIGKMQNLSEGQGRTVLFVSHNMASIRHLCTRALILEDGFIKYEGETAEAVNKYLQINEENVSSNLLKIKNNRTGNGKIKFASIQLMNSANEVIESVISGDFLKVKLNFQHNSECNGNLILGYSIYDKNQELKIMMVTDEMGVSINNKVKNGELTIEFPQFLLRAGTYYLHLILSENNTEEENHLDNINNAFKINVLQGDVFNTGKLNRKYSSVLLPCSIN